MVSDQRTTLISTTVYTDRHVPPFSFLLFTVFTLIPPTSLHHSMIPIIISPLQSPLHQ